MAYNPASEQVVIVDRANISIGECTRRQMRAEHLLHRATYILIANRAGQLYVQRRTMTKDVYPGLLDPVSGGVVLARESYEESARRELAEEMGIHGAPITPCFDFLFEHGTVGVWGRLFACAWDGPVVPQPEEVDEVLMLTPDQVLAQPSKCTGDGIFALRRFLASGLRLPGHR